MIDTAGILGRYAAVLDAVAASPAGLSFTETMRSTGLPRGTVHRLIAALLEVGYLASRDGRKVYVLGPRLHRLLHLGAREASLPALAAPVLERLVRELGETAFLARLANDRVETVAIATPEGDAGKSHVQPGRVMPLHAAASAKAIYAYQDEATLARALARPRPRFTRNTRTAERAVRSDLARVRREGYAECSNELDPGVVSYAVPVLIPGVGVVHSVGVVGLSDRLADCPTQAIVDTLGAAATDLAGRLRAALGPPPDAAGARAVSRAAAGASASMPAARPT